MRWAALTAVFALACARKRLATPYRLPREDRERLLAIADDASPTRDYDVGPRIGKGSFGCVFEGTDVRTGTRVALKRILLDAKDNRPRDVAREVRIMRRAASASVAHVVTMYNAYFVRGPLNMEDGDSEVEDSTPTATPTVDDTASSNDDIHVDDLPTPETVETQGPAVWIAMELVSGGCLWDRVSERIVTQELLRPAEIAYVAHQVLVALAGLHAAGIAHRDLKGENIMLTEAGALRSVRLADFGLGGEASWLPGADGHHDSRPKKKGLDEHTGIPAHDQNGHANGTGERGAWRLRTHCGTPPYMAPEMFKDPEGYGPSIDVWSLGVMIVEMAEGKLPYDDNIDMSDYETAKKVLTEINESPHFRKPESLPNDMVDFVTQCLVLDERKRPSAASLLQHPFFRGASSRSQSQSSIHESFAKIGEYDGHDQQAQGTHAGIERARRETTELTERPSRIVLLRKHGADPIVVRNASSRAVLCAWPSDALVKSASDGAPRAFVTNILVQ